MIMYGWNCCDSVCIGCEWHPLEQSKVATCGWDGMIKYWDWIQFNICNISNSAWVCIEVLYQKIGTSLWSHKIISMAELTWGKRSNFAKCNVIEALFNTWLSSRLYSLSYLLKETFEQLMSIFSCILPPRDVTLNSISPPWFPNCKSFLAL